MTVYVRTQQILVSKKVIANIFANRLPLISFDIKTGPNEIINNGVNGFLIDYDDIKTMENKIELLINNLELRRNMSNEAYKNVQKFKKEEIIIKWDKIFCELV